MQYPTPNAGEYETAFRLAFKSALVKSKERTPLTGKVFHAVKSFLGIRRFDGKHIPHVAQKGKTLTKAQRIRADRSIPDASPEDIAKLRAQFIAKGLIKEQ